MRRLRPVAGARALGLLLLLAVCAAGNVVGQCPDGTPPPCGALAPRGVAGPPPTSLAVLYFETRDTTDAYLADGLTEEITTSLGAVARLQIKSPSAVRRVQRANPGDLRAIGRGLRVFWLVEGTIRRAGGQLRVSVRLVNASNENSTWSTAFSRPVSDVLTIEQDIARDVASNVAGVLTTAERTGLASRPTGNPEAHDRYLRGNYYLARRSPRDVARAIREYEAAARADPAFAHAYARIALAWALYLDWGWSDPFLTRDSMLALGFHAADRALALDSNDAEGWMSRGYLLTFRYPRTYQGVIPAFERALALAPRNAEVLHQYASVLIQLGDYDGAMRWAARAVALEPDRPISFYLMANATLREGRVAPAAGWADSALASDPQFYPAYSVRARVRWHLGDRVGAKADAEAARRSSPTGAEYWGECVQALIATWSGDTAAARVYLAPALARLEGRAELADREGTNVAMALVALGDRGRAYDVLERIRPRGAQLWFWLRDPDFDPVRDDPRFQTLIREARPPEAAR